MDGEVIVAPSSLVVCKAQMVVVIFPCSVPQKDLVTFELSISRKQGSSGRKPPSPCWRSLVPGKTLGYNAIQAQFPEIPYAGELKVSVQVVREPFTECPQFSLTVLSPLESIIEAVSSPSLRAGSPKNSVSLVASIATFLLHNHEKESSNLVHIDRVVSNLLQSQPSLCSEWNLSSVIFGKCGVSESLLHLLVRCKLENSVSVLLENSKGKERAALQQKDYKGKTPVEIARKKGSKRMVEMIASATVNATEGIEHRDKGNLPKSRSLDQRLNTAGRNEQDEWQVLSAKVEGTKQSRRKFFKNSDKKVVITSPVPQPPPNGSVEVTPHSPNKYAKAPPIQPGQTGPLCASSETLAELTNKCLYSTSLLIDQPWSEPPFGSSASLNATSSSEGEEEDEQEGQYEETEVSGEVFDSSATEEESDSDGYEEVLDPANIPIMPVLPVIDKQPLITPPKMRPAIKTPSTKEILLPPRHIQRPVDHSQSSSIDSAVENFYRPQMPLPPDHNPSPTGPQRQNLSSVSPTSKVLPQLPPKQRDIVSPPVAQDQQGPKLILPRQAIALHRNKSLPMPPARERTPPPTVPAPPPPPDDDEDLPGPPFVPTVGRPKHNDPMPPIKKRPTPPFQQESERSPSPLENRVRMSQEKKREGSETPPLLRKKKVTPPAQEAQETTPPDAGQARMIAAALDRSLRGAPRPPPARTPTTSKQKVLVELPKSGQREPELVGSDEDEYDDASTMTQNEPQNQPLEQIYSNWTSHATQPVVQRQIEKSPSPMNYGDEPEDEYIDARTEFYECYDQGEPQDQDLFYHTLEKEPRHQLQYLQDQTKQRSPEHPEWHQHQTNSRQPEQQPEWHQHQTNSRQSEQQPEWHQQQTTEVPPVKKQQRNQQGSDRLPEQEPEWIRQQTKNKAPEQQQKWCLPKPKEIVSNEQPEWKQRHIIERAPEQQPEWQQHQTKERSHEQPEWQQHRTKSRQSEQQQTKSMQPEKQPKWHQQQTTEVPSVKKQQRNHTSSDKPPEQEPEWIRQQTKKKSPEKQPKWCLPKPKERVSNERPEWKQRQIREISPEQQPEWLKTKQRVERTSEQQPEWKQHQTREQTSDTQPEWKQRQMREKSSEQQSDNKHLTGDRPRKAPIKIPQPAAAAATPSPPPIKLKPTSQHTNKLSNNKETARYTTQEKPTPPSDQDSVSFAELRKRLAQQLGSGTS